MSEAFDEPWKKIDAAVRVKLAKEWGCRPADIPSSTPIDVSGALGEGWMAAAREGYRKRFSNLYDLVQVKVPTESEYPDLLPETEPDHPGEPWQYLGRGYGVRVNGLPVGDWLPAADGEIDKRLSSGLQILHLNLLADGKGFPIPTRGAQEHYHPDPNHPQQGNVHFEISADRKDAVTAWAAWLAVLTDGFEAVHQVWERVDPDTRNAAGLKHPLAALIDGWLREQLRKAEAPERTKVLTAGRDNIARIPNTAKTAALATWEQRDEVMIVEVDGEPFATSLQYIPRRAQGQKDGATLLPLPGTAHAPDLRLWLLQKIEESAGVDRRNPLAMDTLFLLTLGSALLSSMRLHVDQLGAMQNGRFDAAGVRPEQVARWMKRAWAAVHWARLLIETPKGHYLPLLPIDVGGDLPEGWLRIWPYQWAQHGKGYRQTGILTMQATRADKSGSFPRVAAGIEDYITGAGSTGRDRRSRLLISERKGGPGLVSDLVPYPALLARAGFYFNLNDKKSYNATAQLWHSLTGELEQRGYLLPSLRSEAEAGDTFEIVEIVKGNRGGPGGVRVRASARLIEAQEQTAKRRGDRGLDAIPLCDLFKE